MPDDPRCTHQVFDKSMDVACAADASQKTWTGDSECVGFLFQRDAALTGLPEVASDV